MALAQARGMTYAAIAEEYGLHPSRVHEIVARERRRVASNFGGGERPWMEETVASNVRTVWYETEILRDRDLEL